MASSIFESTLEATTELQRRAVGTESRALSYVALATAGVTLASGASVVLGRYMSWQNDLVTTRKGQHFTNATNIGGGSANADAEGPSVDYAAQEWGSG